MSEEQGLVIALGLLFGALLVVLATIAWYLHDKRGDSR